MRIVIVNLFLFLLVLANPVCGQRASSKFAFSQYRFDNIQIEGKTNVDDFHLWYVENRFHSFSSSSKDHSVIGFKIIANQVEAGSKAMKSDFLEMINASQYPTIIIGIDHREIQNSGSEVSGTKTIELSMNGVTKEYKCQTFSELTGGKWTLTGTLQVRLTDFGIEPPHKFFGLVKVQDEIFINFKIRFS